MKRWKKTAAFLLAAVLAVSMAFPAWAESRKKITSVSLKVTSGMEIGDEMDPSQVEITTNSDKYYVESYDIMNSGFYWTEEDIPQVEVFLTAEEGYYFSLMSSDVRLDGATYVTAVKPSGTDSTVLKITMNLPSMESRLGTLEAVEFGADGIASWQPVQGAGQYEVRLVRNSTIVGGTLAVDSTRVDFGYLMTAAATYRVRVRPVSRVNWEIKGAWTDSPMISVDSAAAEQFRLESRTPGEWILDGNGWWFCNEDGSYTISDWQLINGKWYWFNESGYMMADTWVETGGRYYYVGSDGAMLKSTFVPGTEYYVDSSGAWVKQ